MSNSKHDAPEVPQRGTISLLASGLRKGFLDAYTGDSVKAFFLFHIRVAALLIFLSLAVLIIALTGPAAWQAASNALSPENRFAEYGNVDAVAEATEAASTAPPDLSQWSDEELLASLGSLPTAAPAASAVGGKREYTYEELFGDQTASASEAPAPAQTPARDISELSDAELMALLAEARAAAATAQAPAHDAQVLGDGADIFGLDKPAKEGP